MTTVDSKSRLKRIAAQTKAAQEGLPEYPVVFNGNCTDGVLLISGEFVTKHTYDILRTQYENLHGADEPLRSLVATLKTKLTAAEARIHNAYEVYAGMEGIPVPVTACESYLLRIINEMVAELKDKP